MNQVRDYTVEAAKKKGEKEAVVMCHAQVRFSLLLPSFVFVQRGKLKSSCVSYLLLQAYVVGFYEKVRLLAVFLAGRLVASIQPDLFLSLPLFATNSSDTFKKDLGSKKFVPSPAVLTLASPVSVSK